MSDFVHSLDDAIGEAMVLSSPNEMALAAIRFIEASGHRIVPVEPTEGMIEIGQGKVVEYNDFIIPELPRQMWGAMLRAAPKVTP